MEVHELHGACERSDGVREPELELGGAIGVQPDDNWVMRCGYGHGLRFLQSSGDHASRLQHDRISRRRPIRAISHPVRL
jgi:hypothetical protein